ncbi:MAG: hypothetical protein Q8T13_21480 [Acidobacteriota bacterium]|nr:hypothetical protein [Acidobacteriota bacterium]
MMSRCFMLALSVLAGVGCMSGSQAFTTQTVASSEVEGGAWFEQSGCTACHSVSAYRIVNPAALAPDLSLAVENVPRRFGVPLEQFLRAPTGTMAMVLSSRIPMTDEQRTLAIDRLKEAHRRHQESAGAVRPVAGH